MARTWRSYPFWYTLLALDEMDLPQARDEIRYAASRCNRVLGRGQSDRDLYGWRRRAIAERAMARC